MPSPIEFLMSLKIETWMEKIDFLMGRCCFLDLIWDEIWIICKFRDERGESHKTTIIIVLECLSRPLEDCKIEEKSVQNGSKFEVQDGVTLGIKF